MRSHIPKRHVLLILGILLNFNSFDQDAQAQARKSGVKSDSSVVQEYFGPRKAPKSSRSDSVGRSPSSGAPRYLAIQAGAFFSDENYLWNGDAENKNRGTWIAGVTYRLGEWVNSMDLAMRFELLNYNFIEKDPQKLSFQALITFPDANSDFPLYFGAGLGAGVFVRQISGESQLSFDYQLLAGFRMFDLYESMGFIAEVSMKNHIHLASDGQFNGLAFTLGPVFQF